MSQKNNVSILNKVVALTATSIFILSLIVSAFYFYFTMQTVDVNLKNTLSDRLKTIPDAVANSIIVGDLATAKEILNGFVIYRDVSTIRLKNSSGLVMELIDDSNKVTCPQWFVNAIGIVKMKSSTEIKIGGVSYGTLEIVVTPVFYINELWKTLLTTLGLFLLFIISNVFFIWYVLRKNLSPALKAIESGANAISKGNFIFIEENNVKELQTTFNSFNVMVSAIKHDRDALDKERSRYKSMMDLASDGIHLLNEQGLLVEYSKSFAQMLGYSENEMMGMRIHDWDETFQKNKLPNIIKSLMLEPSSSLVTKHKCKDGSLIDVQINAKGIELDGKNYLYASSRDITENKKYERRLEHIAHYDTLTGLANRILNSERLREAMLQAIQRHEKIAILYLDLDGFKEVNDRYGHGIGDKLLIALSSKMKHVLREEDALARLGGDEFVAILVNIDNTSTALPIMQKLLDVTRQGIELDDLIVQVSASLGATFYPQYEDVDADQLIRQADQAMYHAKQAGKNRYHIFDPEQDRTIRIRHENLERIQQALNNNEFVLHYQPKINMRTGEIIGVEALIRWEHPENGLIPPLEFLPIIENHPLAVEVGEWVINTSITQIKHWQREGLNLSVSVNIGARQLLQGNFVERLRFILAQYENFDFSLLELEVLETSALENVNQASTIIEECGKMGIYFALDDFGTGYSSLTYLKQLPVKTLKIDQSFVRDMLVDRDDLAILEGIISLASAFRRNVIAEGVESYEHGKQLLLLGCDCAQGYGIARPMPAEKILKWSQKWEQDHEWIA